VLGELFGRDARGAPAERVVASVGWVYNCVCATHELVYSLLGMVFTCAIISRKRVSASSDRVWGSLCSDVRW
jgi:hypothetical protein